MVVTGGWSHLAERQDGSAAQLVDGEQAEDVAGDLHGDTADSSQTPLFTAQGNYQNIFKSREIFSCKMYEVISSEHCPDLRGVVEGLI